MELVELLGHDRFDDVAIDPEVLVSYEVAKADDWAHGISGASSRIVSEVA
jgi:hypothetical protein